MRHWAYSLGLFLAALGVLVIASSAQAVTNVNVGSQTDPLIGGPEYAIEVQAAILAFPTASASSASASASTRLSFLPEPGTKLLLGLGIVGLVVARKRAPA